MKHQRHFGSATPSREAVQTRSLIADIDRIVRILDCDIAAEEEQARVFDPSQAGYPMLARAGSAPRQSQGDHSGAGKATFKPPSGPDASLKS
jgi:hypothetical protein